MQHALLDAAYGSMQYAAGPAKGSQSGKHKSRYSEGDYGAKLMSGGTSRRRGDWSGTRYWEHLGDKEVLTNPAPEFLNLTRIPRRLFDEILLKAAQSGRFPVSRYEPVAKHVAGRRADNLVCPLAVKIMGSLRHMATGEPLKFIETSCNVSRWTIGNFFHTFIKWFVETYYKEYVVGESGVGFDTPADIVAVEALFRQMGLHGIITSSDACCCVSITSAFTCVCSVSLMSRIFLAASPSQMVAVGSCCVTLSSDVVEFVHRNFLYAFFASSCSLPSSLRSQNSLRAAFCVCHAASCWDMRATWEVLPMC